MVTEKEEKRIARKEKADNFWGTVLRLVKYMSTRTWLLLGALALAVGSTLLSALSPAILGLATTEIYDGITQGVQTIDGVSQYPIDFTAIRNILILTAVVFIINAFARYFQQYLTAHIAQKTVYDLRSDLKAKMSRLSIKYFDTHSKGDIMSRAVNDMDQIANTLQQSLNQVMISVTMFFSVLVVMLTVDVTLSIVVFVTVPFSLLFVAYLIPKSQEQFARQQSELGVANGIVEEIYAGHTIVKTYNTEEHEIEEFEEASNRLNEASWKAQFISNIMMPLVNLSRDVGYFGVAVFGGLGVLNGTIALGSVQAFMQYVNQFSQPIRQIAMLANTIQVTIASCERIFEVLDEEEMENPDSGVEPIETDYKVEFDHVQFGYSDNPEDPLLMNDFNLTVNDGDMIAIVGPTGAGKSTLINLLERFYDVKGGSIKYNGVDIRDIPRQRLRKEFSMVLQDTWLFNGTVWENIAYGNAEYVDDEDRILQASKAAYVDEFVRRLPDGYETVINEEGTNISQGQKQLITIARAFLADPEVLILDEATSSVDTLTETLVQNAMNNIMENRTSFVVAHRLSTIRDADKIIVMDNGDVIETGTHDDLMEQSGFYAELYNAQFATSDAS